MQAAAARLRRTAEDADLGLRRRLDELHKRRLDEARPRNLRAEVEQHFRGARRGET